MYPHDKGHSGSQHAVVATVTKPQAAQFGVRIPEEAREFSLVPYPEELNKILHISQLDNILPNAAQKCMWV
jgi:hypothetical protein